MDEKFEEYIKNLVNECLASPALSALTDPEKGDFSQKLTDYFYNVILDLVIDKLTDEELSELEKLSPDDPRTAEKVMEFTAGMPGILEEMESKLKAAAEEVKRTGVVRQETGDVGVGSSNPQMGGSNPAPTSSSIQPEPTPDLPDLTPNPENLQNN